ncbi:MAG: hypothetical protein AAFV59_07040, partial [Pseudomonadota bacterium]
RLCAQHWRSERVHHQRESHRSAHARGCVARYANVERKVDELEAYAETIRGAEPTLEQEFAALERNDAIEAELDALKKKRAKATPKAVKTADKKEA